MTQPVSKTMIPWGVAPEPGIDMTDPALPSPRLATLDPGGDGR